MKLSDSNHRSVGSSSEHDDERTGCIKGEEFKDLGEHVDVSKKYFGQMSQLINFWFIISDMFVKGQFSSVRA